MADTLDIVTLAEGRAAVNLHASDTSQDTEVAAYITAVSRRIDALAGPVVVRTITAETHDGGTDRIELAYYPVSSITTLTEYVATTGTVLTAEVVGSATAATNYVVDTRQGIITRRSGGYDWTFPVGRDRVVVTYVAGRAANTTAVDPLFKTAANVMLAHNWRREAGSEPITAYQRSHGLAIPRVVRELLSDVGWRRPMVA